MVLNSFKLKKVNTSILIGLAVIILILNVITLSPPIFDIINRQLLYIVELIAFIYCILVQPKFRINRILLLFCAICAISIWINSPSEQYQSSLRLFFFIMLLCLVSPLVINDNLQELRGILWRYLLVLSQIVVVVSFVLFVFWIVRAEKPISVRSYATIGIYGIRYPTLSAITLLNSFYKLLSNENVKVQIKLAHLVLIVLSLSLILASGYRVAILAIFIALIPIILFGIKQNKRLAIIMTIGFITISGLLFSMGAFSNVTKRKFEIALNHNSLTYSRDDLWQARWQEFKDSPIIGIGFANTTHYSDVWDVTPDSRKRVSEPSSSWLSLLSNTGILGLLVFGLFDVLLLISLIRYYKSNKKNRWESVFYFSFWLLFHIIAIFVGWLMYAGSFSCLMFWLLTSRINELNKLSKSSVE